MWHMSTDDRMTVDRPVAGFAPWPLGSGRRRWHPLRRMRTPADCASAAGWPSSGNTYQPINRSFAGVTCRPSGPTSAPSRCTPADCASGPGWPLTRSTSNNRHRSHCGVGCPPPSRRLARGHRFLAFSGAICGRSVSRSCIALRWTEHAAGSWSGPRPPRRHRRSWTWPPSTVWNSACPPSARRAACLTAAPTSGCRAANTKTD